MNNSIQFFEKQFSSQVQQGQYQLNPFELMTQPYLSGRVLDFGCGLGNLAIVAAELGCDVLALDAAPTGVQRLQREAAERTLSITAVEADLRAYRIDSTFDCVVSIGLLMFLDPAAARAQLAQLISSVRPGGVASINVLIEGTTFLDMFDMNAYYLFQCDELRSAFSGWAILHESYNDFDAPHGTIKRFATVIASKPKQPSAHA